MTSATESSRPVARVLEYAVVGATLLTVAYHVMSVFWTFHGSMQHYSTHMIMIMLLLLLHLAADRWQVAQGRARLAWLLFLGSMIGMTVVSLGYLYVQAEALEMTQPFLTPFQMWIGLMLLIPIFCLNWVVWGSALTIVCLASALYFGFGQIFPGPVRDLRLAPETVISYLAGMGGARGVYSYIPLSVDTLFLLLIYGGLMGSTRVLDMFAELGKAIGNFFRGGVGYSCVAASSLVGMVTGQTVSCIALTGSMTIPTMKRRGFSADEAGAIETMAANGSQLIPPIMGLGAFLMAVILGVPYVDIAKAAILPAILYMVILTISVYCIIQASPNIPYSREKVDWRVFLWVLPSFVPSIVTVIVLLSMHFSANLAAVWGIVVIVAMSCLRPKDLRPSIKEVMGGMREGALAGAQLGIILAGIGIVVQMLVTTGVGTAFGRLMIDVSGNSKEIALLLGMAITVFIGMGLPTPAAYSLAAVVVIPSLIEVGVDPLVAHFFGFYFAVFSSFTPPVAVGCLMAARISGGSFYKTCWECFKIGAVALILPFFMVAFPNALKFPNFTAETLIASVLLCVSALMLSAAIYGAFMGRLTKAERYYLMLGPILTVVYYEYNNPWIAWLPVALLMGFVARRLLQRRLSLDVNRG